MRSFAALLSTSLLIGIATAQVETGEKATGQQQTQQPTPQQPARPADAAALFAAFARMPGLEAS
ncbi:MAG: hypothetical protein KDC98_13560, partial [Planctomycetes bacterium]|nr:hypothetical protein [Planctomycetota bacterium]